MKCDVRKIITIICVTYVQKNNFTYSQKSQFLKYNWNFLDQLLLPYKFHGSDMWGIYFFIFASCEPFPKQLNSVTFD